MASSCLYLPMILKTLFFLSWSFLLPTLLFWSARPWSSGSPTASLWLFDSPKKNDADRLYQELYSLESSPETLAMRLSLRAFARSICRLRLSSFDRIAEDNICQAFFLFKARLNLSCTATRRVCSQIKLWAILSSYAMVCLLLLILYRLMVHLNRQAKSIPHKMTISYFNNISEC